MLVLVQAPPWEHIHNKVSMPSTVEKLIAGINDSMGSFFIQISKLMVDLDAGFLEQRKRFDKLMVLLRLSPRNETYLT
jgi:hypothetical protein